MAAARGGGGAPGLSGPHDMPPAPLARSAPIAWDLYSPGCHAARALPQGRAGAPPVAVGRVLPPGAGPHPGPPPDFSHVYFSLSAHVLLFSQYPVVLHPPLLPGEKDAIQHPRGRLRRSEQQAGTRATGRLRHSQTREQTPQTPTRQVILGLHRQRLAPDQKSPAISRLASIKAPPIMGGRPTRLRQERNNPLKRRIT